MTDLSTVSIELEDLSPYSIGKGGISYIGSGTTAAPSTTAVKIRAGHKSPLEDRYIKFEASGDCYVGRILSGLNVMSSNFDTLPPHFYKNLELAIYTLNLQFPNIPSSIESRIKPVLMYCHG